MYVYTFTTDFFSQWAFPLHSSHVCTETINCIFCTILIECSVDLAQVSIESSARDTMVFQGAFKFIM